MVNPPGTYRATSHYHQLPLVGGPTAMLLEWRNRPLKTPWAGLTLSVGVVRNCRWNEKVFAVALILIPLIFRNFFKGPAVGSRRLLQSRLEKVLAWAERDADPVVARGVKM